VAARIGVDVFLDQQGSEATFTSGGVQVFKSEPNANYLITIAHESPSHPKVVTDANHYYTALGLGLSPDERIQFMSIDDTQPLSARLEEARSLRDTKLESILDAASKLFMALGPPAGPEAACFTAVLSQSYPV
jgi:hypothetical protein